ALIPGSRRDGVLALSLTSKRAAVVWGAPQAKHAPDPPAPPGEEAPPGLRAARPGSAGRSRPAADVTRVRCTDPGRRAAPAAVGSSKLVRLLEALDEAAADGHKALVFSQWTSLLDLIEPHLRDAGIAFTRLDGSTRDRGAVVNEFQADAGPPVMLASLKAGGT